MKTRNTLASGNSQNASRRKRQQSIDRSNEQKNRRHSIGGGQANSQGITQGQNGEQGNTVEPRNAQPLGKLEH